jgi:uncharacterized protein (TIGR02453 family)
MGFAGFGDRLVDFYEGLIADNSKAYWTDNKAVYERHVRAPMQALLTELEPEFGTGKIFRPYRDVRFSPDKTPYKTHCGAWVNGYYVQADVDGIMVAAGYYQMQSDQIGRFRVAVDEDRRGERLNALVRELADDDWTVAGDQLSTRPRGIAPDHPRLELLRHRAIYVWRRWPDEELMLRSELTGRVASAWRSAKPLVEWLNDHVGPSDKPRR